MPSQFSILILNSDPGPGYNGPHTRPPKDPDMATLKTLYLLVIAALILPVVSCGTPVDVKKDLLITDVTSGWYDAGIVKDPEGEKNRLVPAISFRLKNITSDKTISSVQVNAVYHRVVEPNVEWGTTWVSAIGSGGLKPGAATEPLVLRGDRAYLGLQPRLQMLQNREFVDGTVDIMAKHNADQWVKLGTFPITRQLLTQ